jgi:chromosome segregation ATPase
MNIIKYKEDNIMNNEYNDIDIFDEEFFGLEEGFLSKRRDKRVDKKIGKKEAEIEKIRQKIEDAKERDTEVSREFIVQGEEKIDKLMKEIDELKRKMAERQTVAQESFFDYDEELEELQEALNEKYEELELTVDYLEEGIKNGIVVAKEKFKGKIDAFKQKKLARKIAKKQEQLDKAENEEKIEKLTKEIEELKAKLNVAQESFFVDDNDVEAIEESIKEKIGQLNGNMKQFMKDMIAKKYHKVDSVTKAINKAESQNEKLSKVLEDRELNDKKVNALMRGLVWYNPATKLMAKLFGANVTPTRKVKNMIRMNNMWMNALNKRREQLEAKNGGGQEEAPAQESFYDIEFFDED